MFTCIVSYHQDWFNNLQHKTTQKALFISAIYAKSVIRCKANKHPGCMVADGCAVLIAVCKDAVRKSTHTPCRVELHEGETKGQMITTKIFRPWAKSFPGPEINVVTELDQEMYYDMLNDAIR